MYWLSTLKCKKIKSLCYLQFSTLDCVCILKMPNISVSNILHFQCAFEQGFLLSSSREKLYYLGIAMVTSMMTLVTVTLNCIFIAAMLSQKLFQKSLSNKLLMVLCMVDLLQGISSWPMLAVTFFKFYKFDMNCFLQDLNHLSGYVLSALTMGTIFIVSLEQFIAILHPYFYISNVTFCRLLGPVLMINSLVIITSIVGEITVNRTWMDYYNFIVPALGFPVMTILIYIHLKIIRCASQVAARITNTNKEEGKHIKARAKAAKSGLVVFVATLVCYCPYCCYTIYEKMNKYTPFSTNFIGYPSKIFGLFASVVDPIIYYWRLKSIRKATKDMFTSLCKNQKIGHQWWGISTKRKDINDGALCDRGNDIND